MTVAKLLLGSPASSLRMVGRVTPTRSASMAWVSFRLSRAARRRSPKAESWFRWRAWVGGVSLGMENIITKIGINSKYILYLVCRLLV